MIKTIEAYLERVTNEENRLIITLLIYTVFLGLLQVVISIIGGLIK